MHKTIDTYCFTSIVITTPGILLILTILYVPIMHQLYDKLFSVKIYNKFYGRQDELNRGKDFEQLLRFNSISNQYYQKSFTLKKNNMNTFSKMKLTVLLLIMSFSLSSCEAIAGIFKAGVWTGIILVAFVIGLIVYFISRSRK